MLRFLVVLFVVLAAWPGRSSAEEADCSGCGVPHRNAAAFKSSLLITVKNRGFLAAAGEKAVARSKSAPGPVYAELVGDVSGDDPSFAAGPGALDGEELARASSLWRYRGSMGSDRLASPRKTP